MGGGLIGEVAGSVIGECVGLPPGVDLRREQPARLVEVLDPAIVGEDAAAGPISGVVFPAGEFAVAVPEPLEVALGIIAHLGQAGVGLLDRDQALVCVMAEEPPAAEPVAH